MKVLGFRAFYFFVSVLFRYYICEMALTLYLALTSLFIFGHLLITFVNSLDAKQTQQNVGPDLDLNCLTFPNRLLEKLNFRLNQQHTKNH